jgi:methylmalonyl-CoA mutase C-terminal domain/subunit
VRPPAWPPRRVDHIGIVVHSIAETGRFYERAFGLHHEAPEALPANGVTVAFITVGATCIELVEPLGEDSPAARFLQRRGEGLHHIALEVGDVTHALAMARRAGFTPIDAQPRPGAHGTRIAFLHPRDAHGVMIELVESPASRSPTTRAP